MHKILRNCAILLQNTTLNMTITHALAMTLTLILDPNSIAITHLASIAIPHFTVTPMVGGLVHFRNWRKCFLGLGLGHSRVLARCDK